MLENIEDTAINNVTISPQEYEKVFNDWAILLGSRPLEQQIYGGKQILLRSHPLIYKKTRGKLKLIPKVKLGIHIKDKNKGKFTEEANKHGQSVQQFASHVLSNKDKYSTKLVKRANFARNSNKWNKK